MPRRKLQPTETQRQTVRALVGFGLPLKQVAIVAGIGCVETLRKHFDEELTLGPLEAQSNVVRTLFRMATSGRNPNATIFWCKTRLGWSERGKAEEVRPSAGVVWTIREYRPTPSPEQQKEWEELLRKADAIPGGPVRWEGDQGYFEDEDDEEPRRRRLG
jgi:hypothetical protein